MISGRALDEQRIEGFTQGADAYLAKPYTERELRACIGSIIQSARSRNEASRREALEHAEKRALAERVELLESIDRRKTEFLAVLAHELRNPLAPLRNGLQILKMRSAADSMTSQTLGMMDRQMTHLVRLVDDLLDVSRITTGRLELRRRKALLSEIVTSAIESSRSVIDAHRHELAIDFRDPTILIDGDADRLAQVFSNLLLNSAKYTDAGGLIKLTARREHGQAVIDVEDNGIGIPSALLEQVFDMFSQVRLHEAPAPDEGLGIGLSLVRTLVQLHGGCVEAFSEGEGRGSRFTVRLPIAEGDCPVSEVTAAHVPLRSATGQRVLLVDDNADAAATLAGVLQSSGCEVQTAADGEEAIARTLAFEPHVIFMDIAMPRLNGVEATRRLRSFPQGRRARIVPLTGWAQEEDRLLALSAGMDDHLVKPVSLEALTSALASARP